MEQQLFPADVAYWSWDTIQDLVDNDIRENQYLEYKEHLTYPAHREPEPSKKEWRNNIEREFTAFANAYGGVILFGMTDEVAVNACEPPVHEVDRTIGQFIHGAIPVPEIAVSEPIPVPSDSVDDILVAVRVFEATRKPVATSDAAYYVRVNEGKQPMSREQLEHMFVEADRRQQAVRQLEVEISRHRATYKELLDSLPMTETVPPIEAIDEAGIRDVLRMNTWLFGDEDIEWLAVSILEVLDEVATTKRLFRDGCENMGRVPFEGYGQLNRITQDNLKDQGQTLLDLFDRLVEETQLQPPGPLGPRLG